MIKGQESIFNFIDSLTNLPHSILLKGEQGSGRTELCEYIANRFDLRLYDATEVISRDFIDEVVMSQSRFLLMIDLNKITEREQNIILKLYEEPGENIYLVLKSTNDAVPLDTIKSRSWTITMNKYSTDLLREYINSNDGDLILSICTTPGQVEIANHTDMKSLDNLCENIITRVSEAPFFNVMSIVNKINFKDEYDKFDLLLFIKMLSKKCLDHRSLDVYKELSTMNSYIWSMNNKSQYFEHFLINVWEIYNSGRY